MPVINNKTTYFCFSEIEAISKIVTDISIERIRLRMREHLQGQSGLEAKTFLALIREEMI